MILAQEFAILASRTLIASLSANCPRLYASGCFFSNCFSAYALPCHYASSIRTSTTKMRHLWLANFSPNLKTVSSMAAINLFTQTLRDHNWCNSTKCQCCETAYFK